MVIIHLMDCRLGSENNNLFNVGGDWAPTILQTTKKLAKRYILLTGTQLDIQYSKSNDNLQSSAFKYDINKLATGLPSSKDSIIGQELDKLIHFCLNEQVCY